MHYSIGSLYDYLRKLFRIVRYPMLNPQFSVFLSFLFRFSQIYSTMHDVTSPSSECKLMCWNVVGLLTEEGKKSSHDIESRPLPFCASSHRCSINKCGKLSQQTRGSHIVALVKDLLHVKQFRVFFLCTL